MPSTREPRSLLNSDLLLDRCRLLRVLDSIVAPHDPSFEFHPRWRRGEQMAKLRDGEGDFVIIWFSARGTVVRGFDHESRMSPFRTPARRPWPGLFAGFPKALGYALKEPAFAVEETTFCAWCTPGSEWAVGDVSYPRGAGSDPDGSRRLLAMFGRSFGPWSTTFYGRKLDPRALAHLRRGRPVDMKVVEALCVDPDLGKIAEALLETGWSSGAGFPASSQGTGRAAKRGPRPAKPRAAKRRRSFGEAEFTVRSEPTTVSMLIHGGEVIVSAEADIYGDLFDLVRERIRAASRGRE